MLRAFWSAFLSRKIDVREIGRNFEQIQMVELRKFERDMFISLSGIPRGKLGLMDES